MRTLLGTSVFVLFVSIALVACDGTEISDSALAWSDGKTERQQILDQQSDYLLFFDNLSHDQTNTSLIATPSITVGPGTVTLSIDASNYQCGGMTQFLTDGNGTGFEISITTWENGDSEIDGDFYGEDINSMETGSVSKYFSSATTLNFGVHYAYLPSNAPDVSCGTYFEVEEGNPAS